MCFFDQTRWACGFWRWGNLRQQCTKEYRIGETCRLKLVFETSHRPDHCKTCEQIVRKQCRIAKMKKDIARWTREGSLMATIEKTERDIVKLQRSISTLSEQHGKRLPDPVVVTTSTASGTWVGLPPISGNLLQAARANPQQLLH
ncbi:hypothetical protein B0T26DRAFT_637287 [Lasiosphaeria miniovina]|uniref:Uncharacterized protein n=1 Tax=Lasiosphaeria miniovina TaxID=1954250 RepID=A0AA40B337_9PEZI|nr:uncharacterized protein B0T26DRAFT_637287 [Lasiosphaeria miniovina]KAK0726804.1 hypothetical protein B0T26DRAFT_637287 [Lasiosphaeria miniovina]